MTDLIVDAAAYPAGPIRDAALRRAIRETGAARYYLSEQRPDVEMSRYYGREPVHVLTTPDRRDVWLPLLDPTVDLYRWCLRQAGVPRDKVAEVARKTDAQAEKSKWKDQIGLARSMARNIEQGTYTVMPRHWVEVEAPDGEAAVGNQNYRLLIPTMDDLEHRGGPWSGPGPFALDFETEGDYPMDLTVVGFSFSDTPGEAYYVPRAETDPDVFVRVLDELTATPWVAHNAQYELACLRTLGVRPATQPDDTMVLAWERGEPVIGLKALALEHLGVRMTTFEEISKGRRFSEVPLAEAVQYGAADADNTLRLWNLWIPNHNLAEFPNAIMYYGLDKRLIPILADMTYRGVAVDRAWVADWRVDLAEQIKVLDRDIRTAAIAHAPDPELEVSTKSRLRDLNLNSPEQVSWLLFTVLGLDPQRFAAKAGVYSTDEATLLTLGPEHPIVPMLLEHRGLRKQETTYGQGFENCYLYGDGRLHPDWKGTGTKTGRLASGGQTWVRPGGEQKAPQAQNIPLPAREAIVADPGYVLVAADYSQIELRILAHISQDPKLLAAFKAGRNPHLDLMKAVFGTTDKHKDDGRPYKLAKNINFGTIYGAGANRLREQALQGGIVLTNADTQRQLDTHHRVHPTIWSYRAAEIERMRRAGYAETLTGRRIAYPDLTSPDQKKRGAAEREAFNARIQGTSGDITKEAMVAWTKMREVGRPYQVSGYDEPLRLVWAREDLVPNDHWPLVLQVHDEIVVQAPESEARMALSALMEVMREVAQKYLSLPVEVEGAWGRTWKDCK